MTIQEMCNHWSRSTLRDQILKSGGSQAAIDATLDAAREAKANLFFPVTGKVTEGLIKPLQSQGRSPVLFSRLIADLKKDSRLNPGVYLVTVMEHALRTDLPRTVLPGMLARALVSLPSFMRSTDLYERFPLFLRTVQQGSFRNFQSQVVNNTDPDEKADFILQLNLTLRIWSYLDTEKAVNYTSSRLLGQRGPLNQGLHLLCPFRRAQSFAICDWDFYSDQALQDAITFFSSTEPEAYPAFCRELTRNPNYVRTMRLFLV